jgi:hypothetical protein
MNDHHYRSEHGNGYDKMGPPDMAFIPRGEPSRRGRGRSMV